MDFKCKSRNSTYTVVGGSSNAVRCFAAFLLFCFSAYNATHTPPPPPHTHPPHPPIHRLRESLGISADGSEKCFRLEDIEAFGRAEAQPLLWIDRDHRLNVKFVFTAVDPSGGGASAFSVASVLVYNGLIQVCALAIFCYILLYSNFFFKTRCLQAFSNLR